MMERRRALDGPSPAGSRGAAARSSCPPTRVQPRCSAAPAASAVSTTMAFTRLLRNLPATSFGQRVVPIIPDEARTFGMDALFREIKIYAAHGQKYEPVDADLLLSYTESPDGQILEEGITEAGSMSSFIAAGTSYATRGVPMVPFYIFYSMFGFQRVGDLIWQAADARAGLPARRHRRPHHAARRGPAAPGRAQPGAGLDGAAVPGLRPGLRLRGGDDRPHGIRAHVRQAARGRLLLPDPLQRELPDAARCRTASSEGIIDGLYRWAEAPDGPSKRATLLFSGSAQGAGAQAADELAEHYDVGVELWSATSYKALRDEALATSAGTACTPGRSSGCRWCAACWPTRPGRSWPSPTS